MLRPEDVKYCQNIMRRHGVSYFFSSRWLPREKRDATAVLYAFFRVPDDLVDTATSTSQERLKALQTWRDSWQAVQTGADTHEPVLRAAREVFLNYKIPYKYGDDFLAAMVQDITVDRYATYADLEKYMYGSAAVVGIMMSYIVGYKNEGTLLKAQALGEAMQLTNFLRDIQEDYQDRGRIYLPLEDLKRFSVSEQDIQQQKFTPEFIQLMQFEITRARELYSIAESGVDELESTGRFAIRLASRLYAAILSKIEQAGYNVFLGRVRTTKLEKLMSLYSVWKISRNTR